MSKPPPLFCGNFEYDAQERDVLRLFEKYGPVERIDMKTGFAFVYMRDRQDAEDALNDLDRREWGYRRPRPLKVEWAKKVEESKDSLPPSKTLFVVNFDTMHTSTRDLEDWFYRYGRLRRVDLKRNYAFVEFDLLEDAITAQRRTNLTSFNGRTITVEFVQGCDARDTGARDYDRGGGGGYGYGARGRSRSRSPPRRRSPSYDMMDRRERDRGRDGASPPPRREASPVRRERSPPRRERSRSADRMARDGPAVGRSRSRSMSR